VLPGVPSPTHPPLGVLFIIYCVVNAVSVYNITPTPNEATLVYRVTKGAVLLQILVVVKLD